MPVHEETRGSRGQLLGKLGVCKPVTADILRAPILHMRNIYSACATGADTRTSQRGAAWPGPDAAAAARQKTKRTGSGLCSSFSTQDRDIFFGENCTFNKQLNFCCISTILELLQKSAYPTLMDVTQDLLTRDHLSVCSFITGNPEPVVSAALDNKTIWLF